MALPRRVTELRDTFGPHGQPNHDSGIHATFSTSLDSPPALPSPESSNDPHFSASNEGMEDSRPGRGRPKKRLNISAKRGIIRLFVETSKTPLRQITHAIEEIGGHGKLWVRGLLEDVSETGPNSDHCLGEVRFDGDNPSFQQGEVRNITPGLRNSPAPEAPEHELSLQLDEPTRSQYSSSDESNPRRKAPRRTASRVFAKAANQDITGQDAYTTGIPQQVASSNADASSSNHVPIKAFPSMSSSTWNHLPSRPKPPAMDQTTPPPVPGFVRFEDEHRAGPGRDGKYPVGGRDDKKAGNNNWKRFRKPRRGPSLTLTDVAKFLDGGVKGIHYQVAKVNTIKRRMSSATSEFNRFYRSPTNTTTVHLPMPCPHPLPTNILPTHSLNAPRPEAIATNVIATVWAEGLADIDARKQLEAMVPVRQDELQAFVSAQDDLGVSPLHLAVAYGYPHTCQLLLYHGADANAKTLKGTSVYDFAESAARLTGENLWLYFRILHCRKFVCAGQQPPAPIKSANFKKCAGKRKQGGEKGKLRGKPGRKVGDEGGLRIDTGAMKQRDSNQNLSETLTTDLARPTPQWTSAYTDSPTPSIIRKHFSLPMSDEADDYNTPQLRQTRRSTAAVLVPNSLQYSTPSLSTGESCANVSVTSNTMSSHGATMTHRNISDTGISVSGLHGNALGANFGCVGRGEQDAVPQPGAYSSSRQQQHQLSGQRSAFGPFGFVQNQVNPALRRNVANNATRTGNVSYGLGAPAWTVPNSNSAAIDFANGNPVSTGQYSDSLQASIYQTGYPTAFQDGPTHGYQRVSMPQQQQQMPFGYPTMYNPQYTGPTTQMPLVSVAAYTGADANNPNVASDLRICPFGNLLCDGYVYTSTRFVLSC